MIELFKLINNTDEFINELVKANLILTYVILFLIIFLESGVIAFPFLPGDGLLFSVGVVANVSSLNVFIIVPLLILAAVLGYVVNYRTGKLFGKWILRKNFSVINKLYHRTNVFLVKHGGKAVVISRFFPVFRTYLPFVAGAVNMSYEKFFRQTIIGAVCWVLIFICTGYFMGEIPWVKSNYALIFLGLIILTMIPFAIQVLRFIFILLSMPFTKK